MESRKYSWEEMQQMIDQLIKQQKETKAELIATNDKLEKLQSEFRVMQTKLGARSSKFDEQYESNSEVLENKDKNEECRKKIANEISQQEINKLLEENENDMLYKVCDKFFSEAFLNLTFRNNKFDQIGTQSGSPHFLSNDKITIIIDIRPHYSVLDLNRFKKAILTEKKRIKTNQITVFSKIKLPPGRRRLWPTA